MGLGVYKLNGGTEHEYRGWLPFAKHETWIVRHKTSYAALTIPLQNARFSLAISRGSVVESRWRVQGVAQVIPFAVLADMDLFRRCEK